jgi:hypothetical protein
MLYAVVDGKRHIGVAHLKAAFAIMDYVEQSIEFIFGNDALRLNSKYIRIVELLQAHPEGMTKTKVSGIFHTSIPRKDIDKVLLQMREEGIVQVKVVPTGGKPAQIYSLSKGFKG